MCKIFFRVSKKNDGVCLIIRYYLYVLFSGFTRSEFVLSVSVKYYVWVDYFMSLKNERLVGCPNLLD